MKKNSAFDKEKWYFIQLQIIFCLPYHLSLKESAYNLQPCFSYPATETLMPESEQENKEAFI